jgi:Primase C terminal 2 (PriCT-2)/Protein of unknown function (DUF3987)
MISRDQLEQLADLLDPPQPPPPKSNHRNGSGSYRNYTPDEIADALTFVGDVDDRDRWFKVGVALKAEFDEAGRPLWDSWSQASSKYDAADQEKNWRSFKPGGGITIGSLIKFAKDAGWVPPRRAKLVLHPTAKSQRKPNNPSPHDADDAPDAEKKPETFPESCIRGTAKTYIEALQDRGEWPKAFLFAEWRQINAMLMERRVGFGAAKPRFPHCHDLLIGESGISHKNTSIYRTVDIIRKGRSDILICDNVSSIEGVLEQMAPRGVQQIPHPTALIAAGEYSYLVAAQQRQATSNIIPILNSAYDGVDPLTITRKNAPVVRRPFLNLMTGCTPSWINSYADKEGADLGRFNRCLIFYAAQDRDIPRADHLTAVERQHFASMFCSEIDKVASQFSNQPTTIDFDADAGKFFDEWFKKYRARLRGMHDNLRKLLERDDDQVQIQSLIYAVADGRAAITKDDLEPAIALIEWNQKNKLQLFAEVEFTNDERLERLIQRFVDLGGGTLKQLYKYLGSKRVSAEAVHRKLRSFVALGFCTLSRQLDGEAGPLEIFPPDPDANSQGSQQI